jgi:hypothetical protein
MQIGNFMVPFTKPSQPTLWINGGSEVELEVLNPSTFFVKTKSSKSGIALSFTLFVRTLGVLLGIGVLIAPLVFTGLELLENSRLEGAEKACNSSLFGFSGYIEFEDGEFSCLEGDDRIGINQFEIAEQHFKFESDYGGSDEYRWSQQGDVVTLCYVDRYYDQYFSCETYVRVAQSSLLGNISDYWFPENTPGPEWVGDKPSTVEVDYSSSSQSPFDGDTLAVSYDSNSGQLMTLTYTSKSLTYGYYGNLIEKTIGGVLVPFIGTTIFGTAILLFSDGRRPYLVFDVQNAMVHRKVWYGSSLSKYTWTDVRFETLGIDKTTRTVHHSGDENSAGFTSYHHGFDVSVQVQNTHYVFMFLEGSQGLYSEFISAFIEAIGVSDTSSIQFTQDSKELEVSLDAEESLQDISMPNDGVQDEVPQAKVSAISQSQPESEASSFWDKQ